MFRQKTVLFLAVAALLAIVIACNSRFEQTATSVPPTVIPTPVPLAPIEIDPIADPVGFLNALPTAEATCATDALGNATVCSP